MHYYYRKKVHLKVQRRVPLQVHFLLNRFEHFFALTGAPSCASSSVTQLLIQMHP